MLTSRNNDPRWILATIVESGNRRFWGWHDLFFVTFFCFYFSCVRVTNTFFLLSHGKILQCSPYWCQALWGGRLFLDDDTLCFLVNYY